MEYIPETHIRGNVTEEEKEKCKRERDNFLFNHTESLDKDKKRALEDEEYGKTEKENALIEFANEKSNELLIKFGLKPFNIPTENYHILPNELYKRATSSTKGVAEANLELQGILFDVTNFRNKPFYFGLVAFHETLHLKSYYCLELSNQNLGKRTYRSGVTVEPLAKRIAQKPSEAHFLGLHEAIVAQTQKNYMEDFLKHPLLQEDTDWLKSEEYQELKKEIADKKHIPQDDIIWINPENKDEYYSLSYRSQRDLLTYICSEIQREKPEKYKTREDVFTEFQKAQFTGNLLNIGRDITHTFGEGSFRILGLVPCDSQAHAENFIKVFKQFRDKKLGPTSS